MQVMSLLAGVSTMWRARFVARSVSTGDQRPQRAVLPNGYFALGGQLVMQRRCAHDLVRKSDQEAL